MRLDPKSLIGPAIALIVLLGVVQQTSSALKSSGAWRARPARAIAPNDPYAVLDQALARPLLSTPTQARDPFGYTPPAPRPVAVRGPTTPTRVEPVVPAPPPRPVLTSIIFDADPRATVRYNGRDYSVRENSLFAEFRVTSITASQVVLDHNGESLVLVLRPKGE